MNSPSYQQQTRGLIYGLKTICASNGLGNDGNEYKIIVQTFLYKLCDKFAHELKRIEPKRVRRCRLGALGMHGDRQPGQGTT